jgi:hypothetical protein
MHPAAFVAPSILAVRNLVCFTVLLAAGLAPLGCVAVVVESNVDDETSTGDGDGDLGDGDGDTGDGNGDGDGDQDPGDGDGDGDTGDGDGDPPPPRFRVVVIADPHIPAPDYAGSDESLTLARERLIETREKIAAIVPPPSFVVVLGDLVHDAYTNYDAIWYQANPNAFVDVAEIFAGFDMPVYLLFGDSDYAVPDYPKTLSHELFAQAYAADPYHAVDLLGWRFVFANSEYGQTFDKGTVIYDPALGSFGSTQLTWLGDQLAAGMPTVVFSHFPLYKVATNEAPNNGLYPDLESVLATRGDVVQLLLSGHDHQWIDFPATFAVPHVVMGATRFDTDNFLLIEFMTDATQYEILDYAKVEWGAQGADTWVYDGTPMPE